MDLTPEQREVGRDNYYSAVTAMDQMRRRDFLKATIAGERPQRASVRCILDTNVRTSRFGLR